MRRRGRGGGRLLLLLAVRRRRCGVRDGQRRGQRRGQGRGQGRPQGRGQRAGGRRRGEHRGRRRAARWPGIGDAHRHGHGAQPHRRPADAAELQGRPVGARGRAAGRDRPARRAGPARHRRRRAGARPGAAEERAGRPRALPDPLQAGFDRQTAARHAGCAGAAIRGDAKSRPRRHRQCAAATGLRPHHGSGERPHRPAPGGHRQHRARGRCERHRGDHAAAADHRDLQHPGGQPAAGDEKADGG